MISDKTCNMVLRARHLFLILLVTSATAGGIDYTDSDNILLKALRVSFYVVLKKLCVRGEITSHIKLHNLKQTLYQPILPT